MSSTNAMLRVSAAQKPAEIPSGERGIDREEWSDSRSDQLRGTIHMLSTRPPRSQRLPQHLLVENWQDLLQGEVLSLAIETDRCAAARRLSFWQQTVTAAAAAGRAGLTHDSPSLVRRRTFSAFQNRLACWFLAAAPGW